MSDRMKVTEYQVNILVLKKGDDHWIFIYRDEAYTQLLRQLRHMAADTELQFSWHDNSIVAGRAKKAATDHGFPLENQWPTQA